MFLIMVETPYAMGRVAAASSSFRTTGMLRVVNWPHQAKRMFHSSNRNVPFSPHGRCCRCTESGKVCSDSMQNDLRAAIADVKHCFPDQHHWQWVDEDV